MRKRYVFWSACVVVLLGLLVTAPVTSAAIFEQISPSNLTFTEGIDYTLFIGGTGYFESAPGDVTAPVQFVANYGLQPSDFSGFNPGNIALIERGVSAFSDKVNLADDFGAIGVIIFDSFFGPLPTPTLLNETYIPSIFATRTVGELLLAELFSGSPVTVHIYTSGPVSTPEPATMLLLGLGLAGIAGFRKRMK